MMETKASSKRSGPYAQWNRETLQINVVDERSPITIQLLDANTGQSLLNSVYSLAEIRQKANGNDTQIKQTESGPTILAKF